MTEKECWDVLYDVMDPEIPTVSVVDMGMVHSVSEEHGCVKVEMIPTFMGCPALDMIRRNVIDRFMREDTVKEASVDFVYSPRWTSSRITKEGEKRLKKFGISAPEKEGVFSVPPCPFCESRAGDIESLFGPTACRAVYYCKNCHQPFEGMKVVT